MPKREPELMEWLASYAQSALALAGDFPAVFGPGAPYPAAGLVKAVENVARSRATVLALLKTLESWRAFKNIGLFADGPLAVPAVQPMPMPPDHGVAPMEWVGLVGIIDSQVRELRRTPGFNRIVADLLKIIPPRPHAPDLNTLDLRLRARVLGERGAVELRFRSVAGLKGAWAVKVEVDRGDGVWHALATTTRGRLRDAHEQPERPSTWVYRAYLVDEAGRQAGAVSRTNVIVGAQRRS